MLKIVLRLMVVTVLLPVFGCGQDPAGDVVQPSDDNMVTVSFSVSLEDGSVTRAASEPQPPAVPSGNISSGRGADMLVCAVYDNDGRLLAQYGDADSNGQIVVKGVGGWPVEVPIRLVRGQQYKIAFWAQNSACTAYTTSDLRNVTVDYGRMDCPNNDETRDAFCKTEPLTAVADGLRGVVLNRPFAQINVGVRKRDYEGASLNGCRIVESKIRIDNVATCFDVVTNDVDTSPGKLQSVEFAFATIPAFANMKSAAGEQQIPEEKYDEASSDSYYNGLPAYDGPAAEEFLYVDLNRDGKYNPYDDEANPEIFKYLSMSYILVADRIVGTSTYGTTLDRVQLYFKSRDDSREIIAVDDRSLSNVPVQRNWRTNIIGTLLTSAVRLEVSVDPMFEGPENRPEGVSAFGSGVADSPVAEPAAS